MEIGAHTRVALAANVVSRVLDETVALLDTTSGAYYTINEVGARLVALSGEGRTLGECAAVIAAEYGGVEADQVLADLVELTDQLREAGLLAGEEEA